MVIRPKAVRWGTSWSAVEDSKLLVGLYEHGMGNWMDIKQDKALGLQNKVKCYCQSDDGTVFETLLLCNRFFHVTQITNHKQKICRPEWNIC